VASPLSAQSAPATALGKLVPVSDVRSDWLGGGVESPNGRFYLLTSDASNDSGFLRYDRVKRSWARLGRGVGGLNQRWSPDGRFVAYVRRAEEARGWEVWLVPMDTATGLASGAARRVGTRPVEPGPAMVAWSPDGRRLAFIAGDSANASVVAVPFNGGDEQLLLEAPGQLNSLLWSRDGRSIFVNHEAPNRAPHTLRVSIADKRAIDLGEAKAWTFDISPDGEWLAQWAWYSPLLYLVSTNGKAVRTVDLQHNSARLAPAGWSRTNPNEMVALDHFAPAGIQRVSIDDGRIRTVIPFDSAGLGGGALSPDESMLAYVRFHDGSRQLVVSDTNGGNVRVLIEGARTGLDWSPSGRQFAYRMSENDIRVVDVASKEKRELLPEAPRPCRDIAPNCVGRLSTVAWRSDGRALRYFERRATSDGPVLELHEVDLEARRRMVGTTAAVGNPAFIRGNDTLFLVTRPNAGANPCCGAVQLVNARTGVARVIYSGVGRPASLVANGQWILIVAESGGNGTPLVEQPLLVSLTTGETKKYPYTLGGEVSHGYFLPDGRNFLLIACVTCRDPNYVEKWDLILTPMNGDPPRILTGSEASFKDFWPVGVTRDGRTAFFTAEQSYNTRIVTFALPR
jgi:dipeptidyl aminopeptidase/acylaminoacyl peptidase